MESLKNIFEQHNGRLVHKLEHYIDVYDQYFSKYRNMPFVLLEIGVAHGGSLEIWRKYFGEEALLIGVDVNPECKKFEAGNTRIFIGSQEDAAFLTGLKQKLPMIDVLLDDGGHTMKQQITTFKILFDHVKHNGLYICEDLHTSYWKSFNGGYKSKNSFIEFSKNFIDHLHGWHADKDAKKFMFNHLTTSVYALHFYDSMLVMEKKQIEAPKNMSKGTEQLSHHFTSYGQRPNYRYKLKLWLKSFMDKYIHKKK